MQHVLFPHEVLALQDEIRNHPDLMDLLREQTSPEWLHRLGTIAAYCGVILDGDYNQEDIVKLCDILVMKLRAKNSLIILP